jgi:hypothetical protein
MPLLLYSTAQAEKEEWEFEVSPYLWAMGIDGDIKVKKVQYDASASFSDIIDQAKYGAQFILEANRGRWVNFAQIDYGVLESDDISGPLNLADVEIEVTSLLGTIATGYRAPLGERHSIDLMVGVRFAGFELDVDNSLLGSSTTQEEVFDAIVMLRPRFILGDNWQFMPSASVGAGDSELTWELFPELIYQPSDLKFRVGYRDLNYEFEQGDAELDIKLPGLVLGLGFVF